jgi:hypothetical protein
MRRVFCVFGTATSNISICTLLSIAVLARLPRNRNVLLWIIIPLQLRYPPRDSRLLPRRKLILAALTSRLCCSALFILRVDCDFRRIVARIDDVGPSWRY